MVQPSTIPDSAKALEYKEAGNRCFQAGDFKKAEELYSKAISNDPTNPLLYTNRSFSSLKLSRYDSAISDCQTSISLNPKNMKAYFQLAQAQLALHQLPIALKSSLTAHKFCVEELQAGQKGGNSIGSITELVLRCKKEDWERRERERRPEGEVEREIVRSLEETRDRDLIGLGGDDEKGVRERYRGLIEETRRTFALAAKGGEGEEEKKRRRKVPDWIIDDITFSIMVDPVVTKTGQTYDRSSIAEHLKRSPTDPLTREPLRMEDLRPNLALREACEEFIEENGWAVDW